MKCLCMFLLAVAAAGCSDSKCPAVPDVGVTDRGTSDSSALQCQKDKVKCNADEINAFGICLQSSTMVKVPAGEFTMGKTETGKPYSPEHKVTLKEFLIDKTELAVAHYRACVACGVCKSPLRDGSNTGREPYYGNAAYDTFPVIYVAWTDAKAYCEGIGKRLPTEAEWELAARGTQANDYPWGATAPTPKEANFGGVNNDTVAVTDGDKGKSPYGALNMAGNVWEWVADSYAEDYYAASPATDPKGPATSGVKVARGGGFNSSMDNVKTYVRIGYAEAAALSYLGFRCAKDKWQ
jgi:eukaryotic-like serine/threonine-protein kinase